MSEIAIEIERIVHTQDRDDPIGHFKVKQVSGNRLALMGWALGRRSPVEAIEVVVGGSVVASAPIEIPRPDVGEQYPEVAGSEACGFEVAIEADGRGRSELDIQMVRFDGVRVSIGQLLVLATAAERDG